MNAGHAPSGISWVFSRATPEALKAEEEKLGKQLHQLKIDLEVSDGETIARYVASLGTMLFSVAYASMGSSALRFSELWKYFLCAASFRSLIDCMTHSSTKCVHVLYFV